MDTFDRMYGLTSVCATAKLELAIREIAEQLLTEGFEPEDVVEYVERVAYFRVSDVVEGDEL